MALPVPIVLLVVPVLATLLGGLLAVRLRRHLSMLSAVGAGLLLGAAFLDLLPEAITLGAQSGISPANVLSMTLVAFLVFFAFTGALDAFASRQDPATPRKTRGRIAGAWLIFHSLRDGMAIGASYAASHAAGYAVAVGIAAHDLGDGMNTMILTTGGEKPLLTDYLFLVADALAPFAGGLLAAWWLASARNSVLLLALAAGFFIHMGASDFLPEVRESGRPRKHIFLAVTLGVSLIYAANLLLGKIR